MRNPWANETYSGPWSDTSSTWTEEFKKQVPYKLENQGEFFISLRDFTKGFPIASITYVNDSFVYSYFHRKGGAQAEAFSFKAKSQRPGSPWTSTTTGCTHTGVAARSLRFYLWSKTEASSIKFRSSR